MKICFNQDYKYAHDGLRVVSYVKDQVVDTEVDDCDATFVTDVCDRDKAAERVTSKAENKALGGAEGIKGKK